MRYVIALVLSLLFSATAKAQTKSLDTLLVLALDVSGSVNVHRWNVQRRGYAAAFRHRQVREALKDRAVAVTVMQWSGGNQQLQVIRWTEFTTPDAIERFASDVENMTRQYYEGGTSIGSAIRFATSLLSESGHGARRRIIDISGDGIDSSYIETPGAILSVTRARALASGIIINGLPIKIKPDHIDPSNYEIEKYYSTKVIGGIGSFIVTVEDGDDEGAFTRAIIQKLVREIVSDARK